MAKSKSQAASAAAQSPTRPVPRVEAVIAYVEDQRAQLINCLGALQCIALAEASSSPPPELQGAVDLVHDELQRVINALDSIELGRAGRDAEQPT